MEQLGSHWRHFHGTSYMSFFRKSVYTIQVSLKSDKNNKCFTWRHFDVYECVSVNSSQNDKCFKRNLHRKSEHIFYVPPLFFFENRAVNEIILQNMVEPERLLMTILRRAACRISKATRAQAQARITRTQPRARAHTRTHRLLVAFPLQQWYANAPHCYVIRTLLVLLNNNCNMTIVSDFCTGQASFWYNYLFYM